MKVTLRIQCLVLGLVLWGSLVWAQPANDRCSTATPLTISSSEATVVLVSADTRTATLSGTTDSSPTQFCFIDDNDDDVWFRITTPASLPDQGYVIRAYYNNSIVSTDVVAVGMALYESCDINELATHCFTSSDGKKDRFTVSGICALPQTDYYLRVWSEGNEPVNRGTFRIGAYIAPVPTDIVLWSETFGGGLEANGWTTLGTCQNPDSNLNAGFVYLPQGIIDDGAYAFPGYRVSGSTWCDGAVGFDSDWNDNEGVQGAFMTGPCPQAENLTEQILTSPVIAIDNWNVPGISLTWTQAIREFRSTHKIAYRTKDAGGDWGAWTEREINTEFVTNDRYQPFNMQRIPLVGAAGADSLQFRFIYRSYYYFWAIDDVKLIEQEANNMRVQSNFYAIAPWATIPTNQVYPFPVLADIFNAGALTQHNVVVNHTEKHDDGTVFYNENLAYGDIEPDSLAENKLFPELVIVPEKIATNTGTYTVSQDETDFDASDNSISFQYHVGGNVFALETGSTRSVAPAASNYDPDAPMSYAYGNYFHPVADAKVESIQWGVSNAMEMQGYLVNVLLLQWTDTNGDEVASFSERRFVGFAEYTFTGNEGTNLITTVLENLDNPGQPIVMQAGFGYIAIIEYQAGTGTDPALFLLASEAYDYSATSLAFDEAFDLGLTNTKFYASVLGLAADGNLGQIDYGVTAAGTFGFDIVPVVRIVVEPLINTKVELPLNNNISAFPNPATDEINVKLEFTKPYDNVQLRLVNHLGQSVYESVVKTTITTHTETINVGNFASGNYLLQIETTDGQRSLPVTVIK